MADKKYSISLEVDKTGAIANIDTVSNELKTATKNASSLRSQLKQMQKELSELDTNSEEFAKLSKEAGQLKDKIQDASKAISNQAGSSFERLTANAGTLKDSLLNLDFEQVGSSLKGLSSSITGIKFSEVTAGLKSVTSGFAALGKALLTNPLFLIITGITVLVANFDKLTAAIDGVTDAQIEQQQAQQASADAAKAQFDNISAIENSLRVQGMSEEQIVKLKQERLKLAIEEQKAAIVSAETILNTQVEAAQRNKDIVKGILDFITTPIKVLLQSIDSIGSAFGKDLGLAKAFEGFKNEAAGLIFNPEEVRAEGQKTIIEAKKQLEALENTRDGFILSEQKKNEELAKDRANKRLEETREARKLAEELFKIQQDLAKKIAAEQQKNSPLSKLIDENDQKYQALKNQADLELQLMKEGEEKEIAAVDAKYIALRDKAKGNAELLKQLASANEEEVAQIKDKYNKEDLEKKQAVEDAKLQLTADGLNALSGLVGAFGAKNEQQAKRQFQIQKSLAIAEALISTYKSINGIFAAATLNPASILFPGYPAIQAALAGTAGLAQVAKIRATQFNGGGGGGSGSAGGGGGSVSVGGGGGGAQGAPSFNPVNTDFINNRPPQPMQAYVIASDVVNGVEAEAKVKDQARL